MDIQQATQVNTTELIDFIKWSFGIFGTVLGILISMIYFDLKNGIKGLNRKFDVEVQPMKTAIAKLEKSDELYEKIRENVGQQHNLEALISILSKKAA